MSSSSRTKLEDTLVELLLQEAPPRLHTLVQRHRIGFVALVKELIELLRVAPRQGGAGVPQGDDEQRSFCRGLPCDAKDIVALGERALELEELSEVVRTQWDANSDQQQAAFLKLLHCGIDSPQAFLRALQTPSKSGIGKPSSGAQCPLNRLLQDANFKTLRGETVAALRRDLEQRLADRLELCREGNQPVLVTAPHNIYLLRDGHAPHAMEEYTTHIAQRLGRLFHGTSLSWSRLEQQRSELLWHLGRIMSAPSDKDAEDVGCGQALDSRNRDPNYLLREEISTNSWFGRVSSVAESHKLYQSQSNRFALHLDIHGCRDPPGTPSHLTLGFAAMRQQAESGSHTLSLAQVETFANALGSELQKVLETLSLRPKEGPLVRVLIPSLLPGNSSSNNSNNNSNNSNTSSDPQANNHSANRATDVGTGSLDPVSEVPGFGLQQNSSNSTVAPNRARNENSSCSSNNNSNSNNSSNNSSSSSNSHNSNRLPSKQHTPSIPRLCGAWCPSEGRFTQSQQAVLLAGFSHSCQLELSKSLRKSLCSEDGAFSKFGRAIYQVWMNTIGHALPALPRLPRKPSNVERPRQNSRRPSSQIGRTEIGKTGSRGHDRSVSAPAVPGRRGL